jgi:hypothetical protein
MIGGSVSPAPVVRVVKTSIRPLPSAPAPIAAIRVPSGDHAGNWNVTPGTE